MKIRCGNCYYGAMGKVCVRCLKHERWMLPDSHCDDFIPNWAIDNKEDKMEDYKVRMINEYKELKSRYDKLHRMLIREKAGTLDFTPTCPIELLSEQANVMGRYLYILEVRAEIEGIDLSAETLG